MLNPGGSDLGVISEHQTSVRGTVGHLSFLTIKTGTLGRTQIDHLGDLLCHGSSRPRTPLPWGLGGSGAGPPAWLWRQDELLLGRYCLYLTTHVAGEVIAGTTLTQERNRKWSKERGCSADGWDRFWRVEVPGLAGNGENL